MATTYSEALRKVREWAQKTTYYHGGADWAEEVPLHEAVARLAHEDIFSPLATPTFSSSAMDGFAVCSKFLAGATCASPVFLRVVGTTAAGDDPLEVFGDIDDDGLVPCVEIMTGAAFPKSLSLELEFDACIPYERVSEVLHASGHVVKRVEDPPMQGQNKRHAGSDFTKGSLIVARSSLIRPTHVMAMGSVGITRVIVRRPLRVAVWSTGSEVVSAVASKSSPSRHQVFDANGPYLIAALQALGAEVQFHGVVSDDANTLTEQIRKIRREALIDVIITTGAVSAGKFDFLRTSAEQLGAAVIFHHVAMRPGHPVLFAMLDQDLIISKSHTDSIHTRVRQQENSARGTALFGLPGNPVATAATFRFLVAPYISAVQGIAEDIGIECRYKLAGGLKTQHMSDQFRHGTLRVDQDGHVLVETSDEQSPAKLRPLALSNCWLHVPNGYVKTREDDTLRCFSLSGEAWNYTRS